MVAENVPKGGLEQVSRRVIELGGASASGINDGLDLDPGTEGSPPQHADMHRVTGHRGLTVFHLKPQVLGFQNPTVPDLSARLSEKRSLVQKDFGSLPFRYLIGPPSILQDGQNLCVGLPLLIANEPGCRKILGQGLMRGRRRRLRKSLPGGSGALPLAFHGGVECGPVDLQPVFLSGVRRQVHRKPVRVIELEHSMSVNHAAVVLGRRNQIGQDGETLAQGMGETLLLRQGHAGNVAQIVHQFRIGGLHDVGHRADRLI